MDRYFTHRANTEKILKHIQLGKLLAKTQGVHTARLNTVHDAQLNTGLVLIKSNSATNIHLGP
ncbi:unnamed protein product, partial [Dovyalis caffra]